MITIDTKELNKLERGLKQYASILPKNVAAAELRRTVKPLLAKVKATAPVGETVTASGWGNHTGPANRRGGATRQDARIKTVNPESSEVARVAVGISRAKGKVGWRTGFIAWGTKERRKKNGQRTGRIARGSNFLKKALDSTILIVRSDFREITLMAFQKWAKKNLPQGRF